MLLMTSLTNRKVIDLLHIQDKVLKISWRIHDTPLTSQVYLSIDIIISCRPITLSSYMSILTSDLGADPKLLAQIEWLEGLLQNRPKLRAPIQVVSCKTGKVSRMHIEQR